MLLLALHGCMVGPNYRQPETPVPSGWIEASEDAEAQAPLDLSRWWTVFNDPQLDSLIRRAILFNKDLKAAEARIREARAQRGLIAAGLYPHVDASGSYSRSRTSGNAQSGSSRAGGEVNDKDLFEAGFDAGWEIDLFGGTRRQVEAANADIQASRESRRDLLVSLLAEVSRDYLQIRGNQLRLDIARRNIASQQHTLELVKTRYEAGLSSELDVAQAKAQLSSTEAQVPLLEAEMRQAVYRLGVLLAQHPGEILDELSKEAPIPATPPEVPAGLPSDLLRRRPDIRLAERELAAQTARIGVATAELFPRFSLTGALGLQSVSASDFFTSGSRFWSVGPTVRWPVFDAGRIRANIQVQNARQEQALAQYEKAVLKSFAEVESALVAYYREQSARRSYAEAVDATERAVEIANELYTQGLVDFLNVLINQRGLYQSQDQLAQSEQRVATDLVALYKALGGGWNPDSPDGN
ncbi:MAG: efflux transporter outer membrane subunit [Deltaproteobacteria bacterium]|nr:efflux transporter outer membrane subunit [Deltaproteobacteria bacterium]